MMLVAQVKEVLHLCGLSEKVNVFKSLKEKKYIPRSLLNMHEKNM